MNRGPFTWDPTGTNPSLPPTWTGFTSYLDQQASAALYTYTSEFPLGSISPATTITSSASASASASVRLTLDFFSEESLMRSRLHLPVARERR